MSKNISKYLHQQMDKEAGINHVAHRTKIVATVGPACDSYDQLLALVKAGVNVFRLNFSHGSHEDKGEIIEHIRNINKTQPYNISILADLQGPKLRVGEIENNALPVVEGDILTFTNEKCVGTLEKIYVSYPNLSEDVVVGNVIMIDDGKIEVKVVEITKEKNVKVVVTLGGLISSKKGINLPDTKISLPALTEKDLIDLAFIIEQKCDWVALSFVRSVDDIILLRKKLNEKESKTKIIAKIEKPEALVNIRDIIIESDAIMIARGDLGVELPIEEVPLVQKRCIIAARENAKPVIVATQMLESMINLPTPTRAEATDCANAILDGADALMLSDETSVGRYPIEAVAVMSRIIAKIEEEALAQVAPLRHTPHTKSGAITKAAAEVGAVVGARFLVAFTQSGDSARRMARLRSVIPILALTPEASTAHQLALSWGVEPMVIPPAKHTDEMVKQIDSALLDTARAEIGEYIVIVAGSPPGIPGSTNAMRVHRIGDAVGGAAPAYR